jgi:ATP-dependent Clp protease ATP-binding subunit ClpA
LQRRFNADRLLPEHLILAILEEKESVAVKNLQMLNVDIDELKLDIEEYLEKREGPVYLGDILPSLRCKDLLN